MELNIKAVFVGPHQPYNLVKTHGGGFVFWPEQWIELEATGSRRTFVSRDTIREAMIGAIRYRHFTNNPSVYTLDRVWDPTFEYFLIDGCIVLNFKFLDFI